MDSSTLDFNSFKMQLKARLRVPMLMKSKRLNFEFSKYFDSTNNNDINMISYTQSRIKMNKSYINSFNKFTLNTNLIRRVLSNMAIKDIYEEEKNCLKKCNEVINNIEIKNGTSATLNIAYDWGTAFDSKNPYTFYNIFDYGDYVVVDNTTKTPSKEGATSANDTIQTVAKNELTDLNTNLSAAKFTITIEVTPKTAA